MRRILRAAALLAAATATAAAVFATGSAHPATPHHSLADGGVISAN